MKSVVLIVIIALLAAGCADAPLYVGNEMPIEAVQAFASTLDGYENIWIDREHHGWVTVGFVAGDLVAHQAAREAEFPGGRSGCSRDAIHR